MPRDVTVLRSGVSSEWALEVGPGVRLWQEAAGTWQVSLGGAESLAPCPETGQSWLGAARAVAGSWLCPAAWSRST